MGWIHATDEDKDKEWKMYNLVGHEEFKPQGRVVVPVGKQILSLYGHEFEYDCKQDADKDGNLLVVLPREKFPFKVIPKDISSLFFEGMKKYHRQICLEFHLEQDGKYKATEWSYEKINEVIEKIRNSD